MEACLAARGLAEVEWVAAHVVLALDRVAHAVCVSHVVGVDDELRRALAWGEQRGAVRVRGEIG